MSPQPSLRVMVDANILIAGSVWPRWPYEVLRHAVAGDYQLILTPYIIAQARTRLETTFPENAWRLEQILELADCEMVEDPSNGQLAQASNLVRDPTDIPVALAAINAEVDYLVSEDKDLTVNDKTTEQLRQQLSVLISGTFLREIMGWTSNELEEVRGRTWGDLQASEDE